MIFKWKVGFWCGRNVAVFEFCYGEIFFLKRWRIEESFELFKLGEDVAYFNMRYQYMRRA